MRIFSSAQYCRRVWCQMSFSTWSAGAFPGPVANRLLEASHALKLGAWVNNAGFAVLVVKVDAGIDAEALDQAIGAAVTSADEMERELAGDPDSDEF